MNTKDNPQRIIIAGSRKFGNLAALTRAADALVPPGSVILSGGARGADALGERYAALRGLAVERFPADWQAHGKLAGPLRNQQMAQVADLALVFWDGRSRGTRSLIQACRRYHVRVKVFLH